MARSQQEASIAQIMASRTGTDPADWFLVFKARYGMQVAFEEIYAEMGAGEVATQLLTCCTAVDPILVAGLVPRYCEVSFDTAMIDFEALDASGELRAVVAQHTYGIVDDAATARLAQRAHDARRSPCRGLRPLRGQDGKGRIGRTAGRHLVSLLWHREDAPYPFGRCGLGESRVPVPRCSASRARSFVCSARIGRPP